MQSIRTSCMMIDRKNKIPLLNLTITRKLSHTHYTLTFPGQFRKCLTVLSFFHWLTKSTSQCTRYKTVETTPPASATSFQLFDRGFQLACNSQICQLNGQNVFAWHFLLYAFVSRIGISLFFLVCFACTHSFLLYHQLH